MNYVLDHVDSKMRRFVFTIKREREKNRSMECRKHCTTDLKTIESNIVIRIIV